jgi:predicted amino acid racemase
MKGVDFVNSNSDYTIVDGTEADGNLKPGDTIDFTLNYQALIRAFHANHLDITVTDT